MSAAMTSRAVFVPRTCSRCGTTSGCVTVTMPADPTAPKRDDEVDVLDETCQACGATRPLIVFAIVDRDPPPYETLTRDQYRAQDEGTREDGKECP